jgi:hypothetical protein
MMMNARRVTKQKRIEVRAVGKKFAMRENFFRVMRHRKRSERGPETRVRCDYSVCHENRDKARYLAGKTRIAQNRIVNSQNNFSEISDSR